MVMRNEIGFYNNVITRKTDNHKGISKNELLQPFSNYGLELVL